MSALQEGHYPDNVKPLTGLSGVYEVRADFDGNTYRAAYILNLGSRIYVLHVFQKKSKKGIETPKADMDKIRSRLRRATELAKEFEHDHP